MLGLTVEQRRLHLLNQRGLHSNQNLMWNHFPKLHKQLINNLFSFNQRNYQLASHHHPNPNSHGSQEEVKFPSSSQAKMDVFWVYHGMDEKNFCINYLLNMMKMGF